METRQLSRVQIDIFVTSENHITQNYERVVTMDGRQIYRDIITPYHYHNGTDLLTRFMLELDYEAGYRCDVAHTRKDAFRKRWVAFFELLPLRLKKLHLKIRISILRFRISLLNNNPSN